MRVGQSLLCAAAIWALTIPATAAPVQTDYPALFDAVWNAVDEHFYDPHFHGHDWNAIGAQYRARLGAVKTDREFELLATQMLDELGVSHLYVVPPTASTGIGIGVRFRKLDGHYVVAEVKPLSDAAAKGVKVGDLLVSPKTPDELRGELGTAQQARFQTCEGRLRDVSVKHVGAFWPSLLPAFEWQPYAFTPHFNAGYIRIDRFSDDASRLADEAMADLKDSDGLIIDVRNNSGGNLSEMRLASYFHSSKPVAVALLARDYLKQLGHPVTKADMDAVAHVSGDYTDDAIRGAVIANKGAAVFVSEDMGDKRYTKPVVVLMGNDTGSAAEGFAWEMHLASKATLVGQPTQGYLLSAEEFKLPDGWTIAIPTQGVWDADTGMDFRDKPVPPDVTVEWTRADLCSGRDPDLEKALALLAQKSGQSR
ncbi:MAG: S41 family peptidase [Rhizomicrobium sp.]